ncbi:MAG: DJ-1/PfpI family protein [Campylobacteraceae bacterium]
MPKVLVALADGFEEIEAITIIDVLRRANVEVVTAALFKKNVVGAHSISCCRYSFRRCKC